MSAKVIPDPTDPFVLDVSEFVSGALPGSFFILPGGIPLEAVCPEEGPAPGRCSGVLACDGDFPCPYRRAGRVCT